MEVPRRELPIDDPWGLPHGCLAAALRSAVDGSPARLRTECSAYRDDRYLYVLFRSDDDELVATMREHDAPLWQEDVVEVFLSPTALKSYYEIEVNPLGTTFDARVESPDGNRSSMKVDVGWECVGLWSAVRRRELASGGVEVDTLIAIPFDALDDPEPQAGSVWRANFFRIDRSSHGDAYLAWSPTERDPADFHVPAAFGELLFV